LLAIAFATILAHHYCALPVLIKYGIASTTGQKEKQFYTDILKLEVWVANAVHQDKPNNDLETHINQGTKGTKAL
jgi:hypothetical protein